MERLDIKINSEILQKELNLAVYGHYGFALLMFPATSDDYLENEKLGFIETLKPFINKGKLTVFSIETVNNESWLNPNIPDEQKSNRQYEFNEFLVKELLQQIFHTCGGPIPIINCGAALGGYHAANCYFRRPDIFYGVISMSSFYNIQYLSGNFFNDNCYFNSPVHYLPNLSDEYWLSFLRSKHHVYLMTGTGENENPSHLSHISDILNYKSIPHNADFWGKEWGHNKETWNSMLSKVMQTKL
ncbi:esterase [Bacteroidetes/Chlorobi group bacterium ChocPot_Mid]|jgi:esterase/lipase superfamily enzyme|nr:MAG: esterase [Bacteroidetes/Chlorobi group bacterium ChocPot_Mid]